MVDLVEEAHLRGQIRKRVDRRDEPAHERPYFHDEDDERDDRAHQEHKLNCREIAEQSRELIFCHSRLLP
ncbi:hypothetical protein GCM10027033_24980 [Leucobacter ruminantium]